MKKVLVLTDLKVGSSKQGIELAKKINADYEAINYKVLNIEYNYLAFLPNFLIQNSGILIKNKPELELIFNEYYDTIISSGRRLAVASMFLKKIFLKKFNKKPKTIQILNPDISLSNFDVVISPIIEKIDGQNVVKILGSINSIKEELKSNKNIFFPDEYKKNSLGVLVGGNTKDFKYRDIEIKELCDIITKIKKDMSVCVTFSRRTPNNLKYCIKNTFPSALIYDPIDKEKENIYHGILKYCKNVIVTLDSISMCCEAIDSDNNVNIYAPKKILNGKYKRFVEYIKNNYQYNSKIEIFWLLKKYNNQIIYI